MSTDFDYESTGDYDQEWDDTISRIIAYAEEEGLNPDHEIGRSSADIPTI